jgi:hypothetical protein
MIAELLGGEVLLSELLSGGSFVRQADVFTSASASSDVSGSAFSNSSTAPTAGSSAQLNGSSLYQSLLSASAGSSPSIVVANVNAGFVESFGSGDIVFAAGGYFLSDVASYGFSYTELPSNEVKLGILYADAKSGASYSVIGVLQYAPTPDVSRPLEVRYMYRPQEVRAAQAVK